MFEIKNSPFGAKLHIHAFYDEFDIDVTDCQLEPDFEIANELLQAAVDMYVIAENTTELYGAILDTVDSDELQDALNKRIQETR